MHTRRLIKVAVAVIVVGMVGGTNLVWGDNNWIQLDDGVAMGNVNALAIHESRLYAGSSSGVFVSEDGGNSWSLTSLDHAVSTLTVDGDTIYAGVWGKGVFRSDDAGLTWKSIRNGLRFHEHDGEQYYGEVRHILVTDNNIICVMYHNGTYTSTDRGETWHDISTEWPGGNGIHSMTEFDGYLWSSVSSSSMARSPDDGKTWEMLPHFDYGHVYDWAGLNGWLYVGGYEGVGVWNEGTQNWEYPMAGLPVGNYRGSKVLPYVLTLAVQDGRLFAGLYDKHGVYVFDSQLRTWTAAGLEGRSVSSFLSDGSALYAGTEEDGIHYLAKVTTFSPQEGNVEGGEPIAVLGRDFPLGTTVTIGGRLLTDLRVTNTLITGLTPPGVAGEVDIEVRFPDSSNSIVERRKFLYTHTPSTILTVTPSHGPPMGGGTGIVTGSAFARDAVVKIGENPATNVVVTPTLIHFMIPLGTVGTVDITITNPDGREWILRDGYTYDSFPAPSIDGIHPNRGPAAGGTEIIIRGHHFRDGAVVSIGAIQVEQLESFSATEIRLKTPPSTASAKNVYVVNPDGQEAEKIGGFTYTPPPAINNIAPNVGPTKGGTTVKILGGQFGVGDSIPEVTIGGVAVLSVTVKSSRELLISTPEASAPGTKDVVVRNPNGEEATLKGGFTYDDSLAVEPKEKLLTSLGYVKQTRLLQNYPNPFNPETWMPYQLATEAEVNIVIYDSGGQRVRTLKLGTQPSGLYLTQERAAYWDGRSDTGEWVSSGTYLYHLQAGSYSAAKKMIILK